MIITSVDQLDPTKTYTYADYLKWQLDEYVELIKGKIFKMSPVPSSSHQSVSRNLLGEFYAYLKGKPCKVFNAPFDVRLFRKQNETEIVTVVQPDLCVICDLTKIDARGCNGAPDLIIEILPPATSQKDIRDKFDLYEEAGVREYWLVEPLDRFVDVFVLQDGKYVLVRKYIARDQIPVQIFPDFSIALNEVFEE